MVLPMTYTKAKEAEIIELENVEIPLSNRVLEGNLNLLITKTTQGKRYELAGTLGANSPLSEKANHTFATLPPEYSPPTTASSVGISQFMPVYLTLHTNGNLVALGAGRLHGSIYFAPVVWFVKNE